jgi:hypothetical protein
MEILYFMFFAIKYRGKKTASAEALFHLAVFLLSTFPLDDSWGIHVIHVLLSDPSPSRMNEPKKHVC